MAEIEFNSAHLSKEDKYELLHSQCSALLDPKVDWVTNSANFCAALKDNFDWLWIGFYRKVSDDYLQLGPFQGPVACTFIQKGKGVCGTVWEKDKALVVPDVDAFPGHIACSSKSKNLNAFDEQDLSGLTKLIREFESFI